MVATGFIDSPWLRDGWQRRMGRPPCGWLLTGWSWVGLPWLADGVTADMAGTTVYESAHTAAGDGVSSTVTPGGVVASVGDRELAHSVGVAFDSNGAAGEV
jgi:hypothetical protein